MVTQNIPEWMLESSLKEVLRQHPTLRIAVRLGGGRDAENVRLKPEGKGFESWRVIINCRNRLHHVEIFRVIEGLTMGDKGFSDSVAATIHRHMHSLAGWVILSIEDGVTVMARYTTNL